MPLSFPSNPSNNQTYTFGSRTWVFNNGTWARQSNVTTGGITTTVSNTQPVSPTEGSQWLDSDSGELNIYFAGGWAAIGTDGETGYTGSTGANGYTGSRGTDGNIGVDGYTGSRGNIGFTGSVGSNGSTGYTGSIGYTGSYPSVASNVSAATAVTVSTTTPTIIVSTQLTTSGRKVLLVATGDGNPNQTGGWHRLQIYRNETAIGKWIINENSGGSSANCPWALTTLDQPVAGTYTYSVRAWQGAGSFTYGEEGDGQAPSLIAVEI